MKVTIDASPVGVEEESEKKYDKWEVDCAVNDLLRAEEIKANPELMKLVLEKMADKKKAISSIAELRAVASKKSKEE
jgi:hypothetical protein